MEMLIWIVLGGAVIMGCVTAAMNRPEHKGPELLEGDAPDDAGVEMVTVSVRAQITRVRNDMNPVTLRAWTRLECRTEFGEEMQMSFDGEYGIFLKAGETGVLEHRDGAFVSFTKDSGEVVAVLYRIPAEEA